MTLGYNQRAPWMVLNDPKLQSLIISLRVRNNDKPNLPIALQCIPKMTLNYDLLFHPDMPEITLELQLIIFPILYLECYLN